MAKFEITTDKKEEFRFNLKADNGQVILSSQGYNAMAGCKNGIESVKKNSTDKNKFDILTAKDGREYFNLKAGNGEIIGTSQMYKSTTGLQNGIDSVMKNAPSADVIEV